MVYLDSASNLKKYDVIGSSDPYVEVYLLPDPLGTSKLQTNPVRDQLNPEFKRYFAFYTDSIQSAATCQLEFRVLNHNRGMRDDHMGSVVVDLVDIPLERPRNFDETRFLGYELQGARFCPSRNVKDAKKATGDFFYKCEVEAPLRRPISFPLLRTEFERAKCTATAYHGYFASCIKVTPDDEHTTRHLVVKTYDQEQQKQKRPSSLSQNVYIYSLLKGPTKLLFVSNTAPERNKSIALEPEDTDFSEMVRESVEASSRASTREHSVFTESVFTESKVDSSAFDELNTPTSAVKVSPLTLASDVSRKVPSSMSPVSRIASLSSLLRKSLSERERDSVSLKSPSERERDSVSLKSPSKRDSLRTVSTLGVPLAVPIAPTLKMKPMDLFDLTFSVGVRFS
jgi:hypothetical protein